MLERFGALRKVKNAFFWPQFFFYLTMFRCVGFIGAPVWFFNIAPGDFDFGAVFYDTPVQKSCK